DEGNVLLTLQVGGADDTRFAVTGTPVVSGEELFDPDDVDAAPGQMPQGLGTHSPEAHHDGVRVECSAHGRLPLEFGAIFSEWRGRRSGGFIACGRCDVARRAGSVGPTCE